VKITADNWTKEVLLNPEWYSWEYVNNHIFDISWASHEELYNQAVRWVEQSIADCYKAVYWLKMNDCIYFRFKNKTDYLMFTLKFGVQE